MNACGLKFGMDVGACISSMVTGWLPDWLVPLLPYWPWFAVILVLGVAYRIAGLPGITAAAKRFMNCQTILPLVLSYPLKINSTRPIFCIPAGLS